MATLGAYELTEKIYESEFSLVQKGIQRDTQQPVIIKIFLNLYPTVEQIIEFKHEYQTLLQLQGVEYVPQVLDFRQEKENWILIVSDIQATTLKSIINKKPLELNLFFKIAIKILSALEIIHAKGILHKDINPFNLVYNEKTEALQVIDYGLATRLVNENVKNKNLSALQGTLAYIAPEQTGRINRSVDQRSDLYSLGITFYEMLTGQLPFQSIEPLQAIYQHIVKNATPPHEINNEVPEMISAIVMKMIAKKAEDRYQSEYGIKMDLLRCKEALEENKGIIPSFKIGLDDIDNTFKVPEKLYGRETEIRLLLNLFDKVCLGSQEVAVISGPAGVGKSSLIQEIYKPIVEHHGYFIEGKFDQYKKNIPCLALSRMLADLVEKILTESKEQLAYWKQLLLKATDGNGQILIDLAPELERIIGPQPKLAEVSPEASMQRFLNVLKKTIQSIAQPQHPIVIFWDDLQWGDALSFRLLKKWLSEIDSGNIFFIFSYRSEEVGPTHPFNILLGQIKDNLSLNHIHLQPLSLASVDQMLSDSLHANHIDIAAFGQLCYEKTNGNAFFLKQFLEDLSKKHLIHYEIKTHHWHWEVEEIRKQHVSENVVDLMIVQLKGLPPATREVLSIGACIGNAFDLKTLALLISKSEKDTAQIIEPALFQNYLVPLNEQYRYARESENSGAVYQFAHDKIQEAAYKLLSDDESAAFHLQIGRFMHSRLKIDDAHNIINIVDHLDKGRNLITSAEEKIALAQLNLQAGIKAKFSQAYDQSLYYLEIGLSLLGKSPWKNHYNLTLELYNESALVNSVIPNYEKLTLYGEQITQHAKTVLDAINFYKVQIFALLSQEKDNEAILLAIQTLNKLNYHLPLEAGDRHIVVAIAKARYADLRYSIKNLSREQIIDKRIIAIAQIMGEIVSTSFLQKPNLSIILMCEFYFLTRRYKMIDFLPYSMICYGMIIAGIFKNFKKGFACAEQAVAIMNKYHVRINNTKIIFLYYYFFNHLKFGYKENLHMLYDGYTSGLENGDLEYAIYCLDFPIASQHIASVNLKDLIERSRIILNDLIKMKIKYKITMYHRIHHQALINLIEANIDQDILKGEYFDENEQLPLIYKRGDEQGLAILYINKLMLAVFFNKDEDAFKYANVLRPIIRYQLCSMYYPLNLYFSLVANIRSYPKLSFLQRLKYRFYIMLDLHQLKKLGQLSPKNFLHKYYIAYAGWLNLQGKQELAMQMYEKAIVVSRQQESTYDLALANESLGELYVKQGKEKVAKIYLIEAYYAYSQWGASSKVRQFEMLYPWLSKAALVPSLNMDTTISFSSRSIQSQTLDYNSALKASVALANEIVFPKLIARLLEILVENLGSERCILLQNNDNELYIEGEYTDKDKIISVMQAIPIRSKELYLPLSVIQYVHATQESIVLDDALNAKKFMRDPYLIKSGAKSVLCTPINYQGNLLGLLYFENNQSSNVFTEQRLEFLRILSSQIGISIQNAKLHASFERFVPKQFLELLGKEDFSSVKLGDNIQKTISVLFTDIRNFTALTEKENVAAVFALLNNYLSYIEPIISKHNGFIDKFIGDAIMALFPDSPDDAVAAGIEIQQAIVLFNQQYHARLSTGIGINTGLCMLGTLGSTHRMDGSVISDAVNTASRIESLNKTYGTTLLISDEVLRRLGRRQEFIFRFVDQITLRGKVSENILWEVIDGLPLAEKAQKIKYLSLYEQGIAAYKNSDYQVAERYFNEYLQHIPHDHLTELYLTRCAKEKKNSQANI
ncbi:MAG: AAA family ATPase [Gammaproteobacteria bacterium]|nr:AAA family ATPase [Gammaproteobacteria bacterium]